MAKKMAKKITVALAGLGSRGKDTYAKAAVMVEEFVDILLGNREESPSITSLENL